MGKDRRLANPAEHGPVSLIRYRRFGFVSKAPLMFHFAMRFALLLALCSTLLTKAAAPDIGVADFEGDSYGDWKTSGEALGGGPAHGALAGQMPVSGFEGNGLVNSFLRGDDTT